MNREIYENIFSARRMEKYFRYHKDNEEKALRHYHVNIKVSEAFYPCLTLFEVAYRNAINRELVKEYGEDWCLKINSLPGLKNLRREINRAQKNINNRNEVVGPNKVVAELTFGFWVRLLNTEFELVLWKPLRRAFPHLEKIKRQRKTVSSPINRIRNFRNRIFHHEPIAWNMGSLKEMHQIITETMSWLNKDLVAILQINDRLPNILLEAEKELK